jgi:DNA-binding NarL/FixJ family response regulator
VNGRAATADVLPRRIALVAVSPLIQAGLARAIEASAQNELVAVATSLGDLRAALVRQPALQVDVAVIDCSDTLESAPLAAALDAGLRVVLLSDAEPALLAPLVAGGAACLPTAASEREISAAADAVAAGLVALRGDLFNDMLRRAGAHDETTRRPVELVEPLTPRELQVLRLLAGGLANKHIAHDLGISEHTAKFHVGRILDKLDAATRAEAVAIGLRDRLIEVSD